MKRVNLDSEAPQVKQFIERLPLAPDGIELEIGGRVVCRIVPPVELSRGEKERLVQDRWELIRRAQQRNTGVAAEVLEREVLDAVDEVRRRQRS